MASRLERIASFHAVIPAQAGIHATYSSTVMGPRLRGNDGRLSRKTR